MILINIASEGNGGVGQLVFAPNMLHEGWNVSIRTVDNPSLHSTGNCDSQELKAASHLLEIEVTDEDGNPVKHFGNNRFQISLYAVLADLNKEACLGYSNNDDEGWKCASTTNINSTGSSSVFLVDTTSNHLTSFAVLLGSNNNLDGCGWGWVEIASLVMIGSTICLVSLINTLYCVSPRFRNVIRGTNEEAVMKSLQRVLAEKWKNRSSSQTPARDRL